MQSSLVPLQAWRNMPFIESFGFLGEDDQPIDLTSATLKMEVRQYGAQPGDALVTLGEVTSDILGIRSIDPATMVVTLTLMEETPGKHETVLALTGTAPPPPTLVSPEDRDDISSAIIDPTNDQLLIQNSYPVGLSIASSDVGGTSANITISSHTRRYADRDVAITGTTLTGLANATDYWLYYDDVDRADTTPAFAATTTAADAYLSPDYPARHFVGVITAAAVGGGSTGGTGGTPPGGGEIP